MCIEVMFKNIQELICSNIDIFENNLLKIVIELSHDKVPNVRLGCLKILKKVNGNLSGEQEVNELIENFKKDLDINVQNAALD